MLQQILERNDALVTPSVIGEIISNTIGGKISAREINSILVAFGFQEATKDPCRRYRLTEQGVRWGKTIKGSGTSDYLRWQPLVVKPILELAFGLEYPDTLDDIPF
jgi:hypothetical protein